MLTELMEAIKHGKILEAERIIENMKAEDFIDSRKPDPNPKSYAPQFVSLPSPFHLAAELGQNEIV